MSRRWKGERCWKRCWKKEIETRSVLCSQVAGSCKRLMEIMSMFIVRYLCHSEWIRPWMRGREEEGEERMKGRIERNGWMRNSYNLQFILFATWIESQIIIFGPSKCIQVVSDPSRGQEVKNKKEVRKNPPFFSCLRSSSGKERWMDLKMKEWRDGGRWRDREKMSRDGERGEVKVR